MKLFLLVVGVVLILEGMPYFAAPERMKEWLLTLSEMDSGSLRKFGLSAMIAGLVICWLVQRSGLF